MSEDKKFAKVNCGWGTKKIVKANLIRRFTQLCLAEHFKEANKNKVDKAIQSSEPATGKHPLREPRYEQKIKVVPKKIMETSGKEKKIDVLLFGKCIQIP